MGITNITAKVKGPPGSSITVKFMLDSGAQYTVLPHEVWTAIGLVPKWRTGFSLADGTGIAREISECHLALGERDGHTTVVLGQPGDVALLGVITLEQFGLVFNPFNRTLQPARILQM